MAPYVIGKFLGCDVTMEDDQIANGAQHALHRVEMENDDGLEDYDTGAQINSRSNINRKTSNQEPLIITNAFQTLAALDEDLPLSTPMEGTPSRRKRKQNKPPQPEAEAEPQLQVDNKEIKVLTTEISHNTVGSKNCQQI